MSVIHKIQITDKAKKNEDGFEFVLSDETVDRYGDVIVASGWKLANFKKNPIALFGHMSSFPLGTWSDVRVVGKKLVGTLTVAPEGTSDRIDEVRRLIEAGILKAVSVGFRALGLEPIPNSEDGGIRFTESELVECSVVSVPANPNALAVARSLNISDDTMQALFGKDAISEDLLTRRGSTGKNAKSNNQSSRSNMITLAKRIEDAQARIVALRDKQQDAVNKMDDENPDEAVTVEIEELSTQIEAAEKSLAVLQRAEASLATKAATTQRADITTFEDGSSSAIEVRNHRPFAVAAKKVRPVDYLWRSIAVAVKHHCEGRQRSVLDVLKATYGEDEPTRVIMANMITKAAVVPASTTTSGWADTLVQTVIGDFIESLMPYSIYPRLAALGQSFTFGRNGTISLPARSATPTVAGAFILQGNAIPVKQAAFTPITLTPKKMGVITTMTREISEHSTPSIEAIIRNAILEDTAVSIDTVLMDNTAASATRPQGLQNAAGSAISATSGGGIAALIGDLKALVADLITNTKGNIRKPVWIINPGDVLAMSLTQAAAGGDLPFRDELSRGTLLGYPVIQSTTGTTDTMYLIDAADFMTATGDAPRFDVSDQAVLHMEDTSPAAISAVGTPNTVAAPIRSLWQTDTMAIRMIMDLNWALRHADVVSYTTTMTWN